MPSLDTVLSGLAAKRPVPATASRKLQPVAAFGDDPGGLAMWVHAPERLAPDPALVVVLHGCGQTAAGFAEGSGWLELADRFGFVVLCPEQSRSNNPNLCFNWFRPGDVARDCGEAASIHAMVLEATVRHGVDPRRVFVTGLSAGAAMADALLATYPETFAAGALIAGLPYGAAGNMQEAFSAMSAPPTRSDAAWGDRVRAASSHPGPWPRVSIWQGDADTVVRPGVADAVARQWVDVHQAAAAGETGLGAGRRLTTWRDRNGEAVVELHRIAGLGHGVPLRCDGDEGCGRAGPFLLEVGINSSLEIARKWGLADEARLGGAIDRSQAAPSRAPAAPASSPAPEGLQRAGKPPLVDVQGVITTALRNAGLMR